MLTTQQLLFRRSGLGGSDVAAICGLSPFKRPIDVYLEKVADGEPAPEYPSNAQRFGSILEPVVADEYAERNHAKVVGPFDSMRHPDRPWHLFTLDRLRMRDDVPFVFSPGVLPQQAAIDRVVEIKTAGIGTARSYGADGSDDLPDHIICQVAWYLAAVEVDDADVAALINTSDYREFHVQRDRQLEAYLLQEANAFWARVERREPPPADGSDSFGRYLRDRFSSTTGLVLESNPEADEAARALQRLRALGKLIKQRTEFHQQRLQLAIGDADGIETECGRILFKHDRVGRVAYARALDAMADELGWSAQQKTDFLDQFRGAPVRKLITPRKWNSVPFDGDFDL